MRSILFKLTYAAVLGVGISAQGASIAVANAGFEDPVLADGTHSDGQPIQVPGWIWTVTPSTLVFNPSSSLFTAGVPEGENGLYADGRYDAWGSTAKVTQQGLATVDTAQTYELKVMVGQAATSTLFGDYTISLLKDGAVAASVSNYGGGTGATPAPDSWVDITLAYTPLPGDAGKSLGIRLESGIAGMAALNSHTWFDNVRLSSIAVPEPASVLGIIPLLAAMRTRRIKR